MNKLLTVFFKECKDNLRDRRTVLSSFSLAALGPIAFAALMTFVLNSVLGESTDSLELTIVGAEHAPGLIAFLQQENTALNKVELANPEQAVKDGDEKLVLVIPPEYGSRFSAGKLNALSLIYNSTEFGTTARNARRTATIVGRYSRTIGLLRLQLRGVDPSVANPIFINEIDTSTPAARALTLLATLPYLLILVVFMGGFYLAIDTTAGEREHGSLEPLLTQPVSRASLVLGKIAATSAFGLASLILFLIGLTIAIPLVPLEKIGMSLQFNAWTSLKILFVVLPLIFFAAALLTVVASFAKSYKEAQTYLAFVILIPTVPLIGTQLLNLEASPFTMLVPSLAQSMIVSDLIVANPIEPLHLLIAIGHTSLLAMLLTWLAVWLYKRETILG